MNQREFEWLKTIAATVRECGAQQPITIGTMYGSNIDTFAPLCDVLCGHPYAHDQAGLTALIAAYREQQQRHGKPFVVNECIPGCLDDQRRGRLCAVLHAVAERRRIRLDGLGAARGQGHLHAP